MVKLLDNKVIRAWQCRQAR